MLTKEIAKTLLENLDRDSAEHSIRSAIYLEILVEEMMNHAQYKELAIRLKHEKFSSHAVLHDIGKSEENIKKLVNKPGRLTDKERNIVNAHVDIGREILKEQNLNLAATIAESHHEKWDGSGYPSGLKGEKIPITARLMSIADVYDALASERVYKKAFSHEDTCDRMEKDLISHFDPNLFNVFKLTKSTFREQNEKFKLQKERGEDILYKYLGGNLHGKHDSGLESAEKI